MIAVMVIATGFKHTVSKYLTILEIWIFIGIYNILKKTLVECTFQEGPFILVQFGFEIFLGGISKAQQGIGQIEVKRILSIFLEGICLLLLKNIPVRKKREHMKRIGLRDRDKLKPRELC
jgi:hypothetical protein